MIWSVPAPFIRRCGGTGRHKGLKIPRWKHRTGSIPVSGTKYPQHADACWGYFAPLTTSQRIGLLFRFAEQMATVKVAKKKYRSWQSQLHGSDSGHLDFCTSVCRGCFAPLTTSQRIGLLFRFAEQMATVKVAKKKYRSWQSQLHGSDSGQNLQMCKYPSEGCIYAGFYKKSCKNP